MDPLSHICYQYVYVRRFCVVKSDISVLAVVIAIVHNMCTEWGGFGGEKRKHHFQFRNHLFRNHLLGSRIHRRPLNQYLANKSVHCRIAL